MQELPKIPIIVHPPTNIVTDIPTNVSTTTTQSGPNFPSGFPPFLGDLTSMIPPPIVTQESKGNLPTSEVDLLARSEIKKQKFNEEFLNLTDQLKEAISIRCKFALEIGTSINELTSLDKYLHVYQRTSPHEHYRYFESIYIKNRSKILGNLEDDTWLRKGLVIVQYGDGVKTNNSAIEEKRRSIRILLSDIYVMACELQDQANAMIIEMDSHYAKEIGGRDLTRPEMILLYLMRIFYYLSEGNDKKTLGEFVTILENRLEIPIKTVPVAATPVTPQIPNFDITGFGKAIFGIAGNVMAKAKSTIDDDAPLEDQLSSVLKGFVDGDGGENIITNVMNGLKGVSGFEGIADTLAQSFNNDATKDVLKNTIDSALPQIIQGLDSAGLTNEKEAS